MSGDPPSDGQPVVLRRTFDHVASAYDAARPDYPAQLYDTLESALGQPLLRADVADIGAGTGIATRAFAGRGAKVVAVDPGPGVLALLRSRSTSRVSPIVGDGNTLPLRDNAFDLVSYAQSWHWIDPAAAVPEAVRVLKPRGVLGLFWNFLQADGAPWWDAYVAAATALSPTYEAQRVDHADWGADLERSGRFGWVAKVEIPWTRTVPVGVFLTDYSSHSYVSELHEAARVHLLAVLGEGLSAAYPGGVAELAYLTRLWVARR